MTEKKLCAAIACLMLLTTPGKAEKVAVLKEVLRPAALAVGHNRVYVSQKNSIAVYSLQPFRFLTAVGKRGEGPGEFKLAPGLQITRSGLTAHSTGKFLKYSPEGKLEKEVKIRFRFSHFMHSLLDLDKGMAGFNLLPKKNSAAMTYEAQLYDGVQELKKNFYTGGSPGLPPPPPMGSAPRRFAFPVIKSCLDMGTDSDRIVVGDSRKGFFFAVFNRNGRLIREIRLAQKPLTFDSGYRSEYLRYRSELPGWENEKKIYDFVFPREFPSFFAMKVKEGHVIILTYVRKKGLYQARITDFFGKEIARVFCYGKMPFDRLSERGPLSREIDIYKGWLYYLQEDPEQEVWELHRHRVIPSS